MALFGITVLMALARVDGLTPHPVMTQQSPITLGEEFRMTILVYRQAHPIRAMLFRYATQLPQGVLHAGTETLEALAEANRHVLPIRVSQNEVVHQVRKRHAGDRDLQTRQVGEV
jgi:hypothetical protein